MLQNHDVLYTEFIIRLNEVISPYSRFMIFQYMIIQFIITGKYRTTFKAYETFIHIEHIRSKIITVLEMKQLSCGQLMMIMIFSLPASRSFETVNSLQARQTLTSVFIIIPCFQNQITLAIQPETTIINKNLRTKQQTLFELYTIYKLVLFLWVSVICQSTRYFCIQANKQSKCFQRRNSQVKVK